MLPCYLNADNVGLRVRAVDWRGVDMSIDGLVAPVASCALVGEVISGRNSMLDLLLSSRLN